VVSDEAYKPDMYHSSFLVTKGKDQFPVVAVTPSSLLLENNYGYISWIVILGAIIVVIIWYASKKRRTK
jgi:peptide/nickel transport system substrate-binding protein